MNKVTFKCKRSGNLISFSNENDIAGLRKHEGYTEVVDTEIKPQKETLSLKPRKVKAEIPAFLQE